MGEMAIIKLNANRVRESFLRETGIRSFVFEELGEAVRLGQWREALTMICAKKYLNYIKIIQVKGAGTDVEVEISEPHRDDARNFADDLRKLELVIGND